MNIRRGNSTSKRCVWKQPFVLSIFFILLMVSVVTAASFTVVDTGQNSCFNAYRTIDCPHSGEAFYGQDAQYMSVAPSYRDNGDGTISDLNTGLMWSKGLDSHKVTPDEGEALAAKLTLAGYSDWRVPTIKELYSLMDFRGYTGMHGRFENRNSVPKNAIPYINTDYFDFAFGNVEMGERYIDAQWLSSTKYVSTTMNSMSTVFGVNFADGRIKGYGYQRRGSNRHVKTFYIRYVRGAAYGNNNFVDNNDNTVTDRATGLMWVKVDSGQSMNWQQALAYAEGLTLSGYNDWRLPNAKELQAIVDYSRSPDTTNSPAIDPIFQTTAITNEAGQRDYPFFWTSTTHLDGPRPGSNAAYIAFGRAIGQMRGQTMDVHGAGAQRSDPKQGRGGLGHGPQGDARRVQNYVRCVRGGTEAVSQTEKSDRNIYPNKIRLVKLDRDPNLVLGQQAQRTGNSGRKSEQGLSQQKRKGVQGGQNRQGRFVQRLDRDGDGKVSRSEFDGPPDRFDFHDANRDGYLSSDEAPQGPPPAAR